MERDSGLNSNDLKWIAAAAMLLDHTGIFFRQEINAALQHAFGVPAAWLYCVYGIVFFLGRMVFPLFAFQVAEGISKTRSVKRYLVRLLIFGVLAEFPFRVMLRVIRSARPYGLFPTNVMFTLLLAVLACICYRWLLSKGMPQLVCLGPGLWLGMIAEKLHMDYGMLGVMAVLFLYMADDFRQKQIVLGFWCVLCYGIPLLDLFRYQDFSWPWFLSTLMRMLYAMLSILIVRKYNGQRGKGFRYLFYVFYPLHLWILFFLYMKR